MPFLTTTSAGSASNRTTRSHNAAPHRKNAAQRSRSDSPYQQRTTQRDNPTQVLIKQAVDYLIQQLEAGKSETLTTYLNAMARFHSYSFGNILQIARQRPTATRVAGFSTWKELGPFVLLRGCSGKPFTQAVAFGLEITSQFQLQQDQNRRVIERRAEEQKRFPHTGARYSNLSVERFRALPKYHDRPAAADMAFCISALSLEMPEDTIMRALEDDYLSRDPNPSRRTSYIRRTLSKARSWTRM